MLKTNPIGAAPIIFPETRGSVQQHFIHHPALPVDVYRLGTMREINMILRFIRGATTDKTLLDRQGTMEKSDLLKAIEDWEESVKWIEYGWDCIEEYTHDLMSREYLDEEVAKASNNEIKSFTSRIEKVDQRFLSATFPDNRCVWSSDIESNYGYLQEKNWYYYRWPNDLRKQEGT